LFAHATLA
jgi:hypothetical protein